MQIGPQMPEEADKSSLVLNGFNRELTYRTRSGQLQNIQSLYL